MDILDQISQEAQKAGSFLVEKAGVVKDYTVATWNAAELKNKINQLYKNIGLAVYKAQTEGADTAEEVNGYVAEITVLKEALQEKEEVRQTLQNKKICGTCNKPVAKNSAFCPHCGANFQ